MLGAGTITFKDPTDWLRILDDLKSIKKGEEVIYHSGDCCLNSCTPAIKVLVRKLKDEGRITLVQRRIEKPRLHDGTGSMAYIAQGL